MIVPINCNVASAVVLEQNANPPKMLLLRRATEVLRDQWCHVAGGIEAGESAWQAALREVREETGLHVLRLFSADYTEQFYEAARNVVTIVPAFVAYVDSTQTVRLNAEHSAYRWVSFRRPTHWSPLAGNVDSTKRCAANSLTAHRRSYRKSGLATTLAPNTSFKPDPARRGFAARLAQFVRPAAEYTCRL